MDAKSATLSPKDLAEVTVRYLDDDYARAVKPHQRFLISKYLINYWIPRLGPTPGWIVVTLHQMAWRFNSDHFTIKQDDIAQEIGIHRHTVSKWLKENPWCSWLVHFESQSSYIDSQGNFVRPANQYELYLPIPLIPEHLGGLFVYFQQAQKTIGDAINHLLGLKPRECLALLEQLAPTATQEFTEPLSIKNVVELAIGQRFDSLPVTERKDLTARCSSLQSHLVDSGTLCLQYFRRTWLPRLGSALAWLVMATRSRCYYNAETGELRDTYLWQKSELTKMVGRTMKQIHRLLKTEDATRFIQVEDETARTITLRVAMVEEPRPTEAPEVFWDRQPAQKLTFFDSAPPKNLTFFDSASPPKLTFFDSASQQGDISRLSSDQNGHSSTHKSTINESVLDVVEGFPDSETDTGDSTNKIDETTRSILRQAGLTGVGLNKLLQQKPDLTPLRAKAVVLYAEANNLGTGYIYRCLQEDGPLDEVFEQFAALDDDTLMLFRQAVEEIKQSGPLRPTIRSPIPESHLDLFVQFAWIFGGISLEATTLYKTTQPAGEPPRLPSPDDSAEVIFWSQVLGQLQLQIPRQAYDTWVKNTRLLVRDEEDFTVATQSNFAKDWLENRLSTTIQRAIALLIQAESRQATGKDQPIPQVRLKFVVEEPTPPM